MNRSNLDTIINQFINSFDELNIHDGSDEGYKWRGVSCFKKNWDIDATDFPDMFKRSMKETGCLIDNSSVQPIGGILKLLKYDDEIEFVRECFRELFSEDNGDLKVRQKRIELFRDKINNRIEKYVNGSWKYPQTTANVISYLNLWKPEDNFLYKPSIADAWADCIEFGDDFGNGTSFSLEIYYQMCNELLDELPKYPKLLELQDERMKREADGFDDKLHILVYDIIYCAHTYDFYVGMPIKKVSVKERINKAKKEEENAARLAELQEKEADLRILEDELKDIRDLTGCTVKHKIFKDGVVKSYSGKSVVVNFSGQEKKFVIPDSVISGFITFDDETVTAEILAYVESSKKIKAMKKEIEGLKSSMEIAT